MLFEVLGLGCGFGPLNLRFMPPLGSFLYWLRPGTIRLPPWPGRVPLTGGDSRTVVDVVLYAALLASLVVAAVLGRARRAWQVAACVLGLLAAGRAARQDDLPGGPLGDLRHARVTFLFTDGRPDRRRQAGDARDLVGRGDLQAQPALPLRRRGDDEQQPGAGGSAGSSGGSTATSPTTCARPGSRRALAHGGTVVEFGVPLCSPARRRRHR